MKKSASFTASLALFMLLSYGNYCTGLVQADQAQYLYDAQERLTGVTDSASSLALYNYDSVGNLLSIDRLAPPGSGIGIYLVNLITGPVTQLCRLQCYGFEPVVRTS